MKKPEKMTTERFNELVDNANDEARKITNVDSTFLISALTVPPVVYGFYLSEITMWLMVTVILLIGNVMLGRYTQFKSTANAIYLAMLSHDDYDEVLNRKS